MSVGRELMEEYAFEVLRKRHAENCKTTVSNADKFQTTFGFDATVMWAMPEGEFFEWLNAEYKEEK